MSAPDQNRQLRFVEPRHDDLVRGLTKLALIVPLGVGGPEYGEWFYESNDGRIPAPDLEIGTEIIHRAQAAGDWSIIPPGTAIYVRRSDARAIAFDAFERWMVRNGFPFDHIDGEV